VGATTITVSVCDDDPLVEEVGLPGLRVMKTADVEAVHRPGDLVRYAVTVTNVGAADFTARDPARVTDHLAGVADDALLDVSSIRPAGVSWDPDARTLSWSGPLKAGASQTISYEVAYSAAPGDRLLQNTAVIHPEDQVDATPGTKAETSTPGSDLHLTKTADVAETSPGGRVRYTVTLDNSLGRVAAPVDWTDDLTGVLDDAQLDSEPEVDGQGVRVQLDGDRITLGGTVGAGEKVLVRYSALVAEDGGAGDRVLRNALLGRCADGPCPPPEECRADDPLTTCTPVIAYSVAKEVVDWPGGAAPGEGDSVTYRLTFVNTGGAEAQVFQVDDLSGVLDDSDFAGVDLAGAGALSATLVGGSLVVRGPLALGARSVVEYRVMVRPAAERGDSVLHNLVSPSGEETLTPVADLEVVKSAVPSRARPGDVVTYTIALRALGTAGVPVSLVDTLTWVVDDAVVLEEPVSDNPAVTVEYAPGAGASSIEGWLEPGEAARIVYRVKVLEEAELGDLVMTNVVLGRGNLPFDGPARCEVLPKGSCTVTPVDLEREPAPKALPTTGAQGALGAGVLAAVLALAGLVVLGWSRLRLRRLA
jgi:uncharacterized repeat protein (TIGR01451 family)